MITKVAFSQNSDEKADQDLRDWVDFGFRIFDCGGAVFLPSKPAFAGRQICNPLSRKIPILSQLSTHYLKFIFQPRGSFVCGGFGHFDERIADFFVQTDSPAAIKNQKSEITPDFLINFLPKKQTY